MAYKAIRIIRIISKRNPHWLQKTNIIQPLLRYWNKKNLESIEDDLLKELIRDEITQILKIFVQYAKDNHRSIKIIFDMLPIFNLRQASDLSFLYNFYKYYIGEHYTSEEKRLVFEEFLKYIKNPEVPIETIANASYVLIYPMMLKCFKAGKAKEMFT
mmetsp:Transcript_36717/g.32935  ORF Transcript_36717/g.32935 Transcript_36717/m.32935 type:complete len:158 (-) Transcript_36717:1329-1802(-)